MGGIQTQDVWQSNVYVCFNQGPIFKFALNLQ